MIKILKYGEVKNADVFARVTPEMNVEAIVSEIIENVKSNGDKALLEYSEKFDKAKLTDLEVSKAEIDEAVSMVENPDVRIIDASTAHRTNPQWAYGFPELSREFRNKIKNSKRVAVPGCYASGFNSIVYPLVKEGIFAPYQYVTSYAVSGYSGAGKKGIAQYEDENRAKEFDAPRMYALAQNHKHLKEMQAISGLSYPPMFNPMVCDYYAGMIVAVPIVRRTLAKRTSIKEIHEVLKNHYRCEHFVKVMSLGGEEELENGFMSANALEGTNNMQIFVSGNDEQILICSRLDNLGKGASGAAVQCLNIMMGIDEKTGLE